MKLPLNPVEAVATTSARRGDDETAARPEIEVTMTRRTPKAADFRRGGTQTTAAYDAVSAAAASSIRGGVRHSPLPEIKVENTINYYTAAGDRCGGSCDGEQEVWRHRQHPKATTKADDEAVVPIAHRRRRRSCRNKGKGAVDENGGTEDDGGAKDSESEAGVSDLASTSLSSSASERVDIEREASLGDVKAMYELGRRYAMAASGSGRLGPSKNMATSFEYR